MAATLIDVAARAGVSLATASRVLNGSTRSVTPSLRARVLAAASELGYVPNAHAQALVRANTHLVGVVVGDMSDPYFSEIGRGIQEVASAANRLVTICNSYRDPERELAYVRLLHAQRVEALILAGSGLADPEYGRQMAEQLTAMVESGARVVLLGRHHIVGDAIIPDNVGGARAIAEHLVALGHRRIGVIGGPQLLTTSHDRLESFREVLRAGGIALPDAAVVSGAFSRDGGTQALHTLLDRFPDLSAVYALNDVMAIGALTAIRQRGLRVPEDISVVGFDDIPLAADVTPTLTTVHVPMVAMGMRAMELALQSAGAAARLEYMPTELVVRASSARPARP